VHGYEENVRRDLLYNEVSMRKHKIWNSEYGEDDATGERLARNLILDFRWLHPRAWVYWQSLDWAGWGLIDANLEAGTIAEPSQKYFVLAHFSRHIRPGMRILDGGSDYTVAAYDAEKEKLVVVAVNWSNSGHYISFDLGKFSKPSSEGARVLRWSSQIGDAGGERYKVFTGDTFAKGTRFWSWSGARALQRLKSTTFYCRYIASRLSQQKHSFQDCYQISNFKSRKYNIQHKNGLLVQKLRLQKTKALPFLPLPHSPRVIPSRHPRSQSACM